MLQSRNPRAHSIGSSPLLLKVTLPHRPGRTEQFCVPRDFFILNCGIGPSVSCPQSYDVWKTSLKAENHYSEKPSGRSSILAAPRAHRPRLSSQEPHPMSALVSPNLPPCPLLPPPEPTPPTPHFPCWACPFQGELTAEGPIPPEKPQPLPRGL